MAISPRPAALLKRRRILPIFRSLGRAMAEMAGGYSQGELVTIGKFVSETTDALRQETAKLRRLTATDWNQGHRILRAAGPEMTADSFTTKHYLLMGYNDTMKLSFWARRQGVRLQLSVLPRLICGSNGKARGRSGS